MPSIGAHVKGGMKGGVAHALEIGAQSMQVFVGSPQMWGTPKYPDDVIDGFRNGVAENNLGPVFVHGIYLVNLASGADPIFKRSISALKSQLVWSNRIGAKGLIFHPGSALKDSYEVAIGRVVTALAAVLEDYDGTTRISLEVCAGQGQTIGDQFEELADIIHALGDDERIGVCWDTCHLFNAGFDVSTEDGLNETVEAFDRIVGFDRLDAIHANDSKTTLGARLDRHENIGQGHIGEEAFRRMLNHPRLRDLPWILEVPGMEKKGPDAANIQLLHKLAGGQES